MWLNAPHYECHLRIYHFPQTVGRRWLLTVHRPCQSPAVLFATRPVKTPRYSHALLWPNRTISSQWVCVAQRLGFTVRHLDHSGTGTDLFRSHVRPSTCFSQYLMADVADAYPRARPIESPLSEWAWSIHHQLFNIPRLFTTASTFRHELSHRPPFSKSSPPSALPLVNLVFIYNWKFLSIDWCV